jgi:hypothetical protein
MKKLAVLSLAAFVSLSSVALAAGVKVTNNSGLPIDELFLSEPGKKAWGDNIMAGIAEGALDNGKTVELPITDGTFDFRVSAPDEGVLCYMENVAVKGDTLELTPDMGKACK